jgi:prevent-host-death family protein
LILVGRPAKIHHSEDVINIAVTEAEGQLAEPVQRAESGEEVVLTHDGTPAVRLVPILDARKTKRRAAVIDAIAAAAAARATPGPCAARRQDLLYDDETGLPA